MFLSGPYNPEQMRKITTELICLYYRYQQGRVDCDTSPYTTDVADYPSGIGDTDHVVSFFADQFGFNEQEATAIMGECWPWFTFFLKANNHC